MIDSQHIWDVAVIGAGPAGALAACLLARQGSRVLLLERSRLPRPKVCGGCLNARGMSVLAAHGLEHVAHEAHGVPLDEISFYRERRSVAIRGAMGMAIERSAFDAGIAAAAQLAGATLVDGVAATVVAEPPTDCRRIILRRAGHTVDEVRARLVVAADGLGHPALAELPEFTSAVAASSRVGLGVVGDPTLGRACKDYRTGKLHMVVAAGGYLGVTRLADGRFCIGAALEPRVVRRGSDVCGWLAEAIAACGLPHIDGLATAAIKGTPLLTRRTSRVASHRILLVGDATGYVEPITGEGMTCALVGAAALAPLAAAACCDWTPAVATAWRLLFERVVVRRQRVNRALASAFRSPTWTRALFAAASACPAAVAPIARYLNRPLSLTRMAA